MENETGKVCGQGLAFFGKSNRLISHELKNVLAIISETTELMGELIALSEEGMPLDPGKLRNLGQSILEDVARANGIVRSMNAFAHGVDTIVSETDVAGSITLALALVRMDPTARKAQINVVEKASPRVTSSPFFLQKMIFDAVRAVLKHPDPSLPMEILLESDGDGARISISGFSGDLPDHFPPPGAVP